MLETQDETNRSRTKWSFAAVSHMIRRLARKPSRPLESVAEKSWEISPSETSIAPPAYFLPNQLERVTDWVFASEHPARAMNGGNVNIHRATRGFLLKDVWLIDGTLYKGDARSWLKPRSSRWPQLRVACEIDRGALYCSALGNKYFGSWLIEDCVTYPLAYDEGIPVTTTQFISPHKREYEDMLGMRPARLHNAFFRELVIFEDVGQNRSKYLRFRAMSDRLLANVQTNSHAGVFILRGGTGVPRLLHNEMELAERMRKQRGFRILDITKVDVPTILATCAGARTIMGVEGSQLVHGLLTLQPGSSMLVLQPPDRFGTVFKDMADRDQQKFGFVVGQAEGKGFRIDPDEVERTLDLFSA